MPLYLFMARVVNILPASDCLIVARGLEVAPKIYMVKSSHFNIGSYTVKPCAQALSYMQFKYTQQSLGMILAQKHNFQFNNLHTAMKASDFYVWLSTSILVLISFLCLCIS
jgi:hypothetical protein